MLIAARPPLFKAGLERLAECAGFEIAEEGPAGMGLRTHDEPPQGGVLDIVAEPGRISLTITGPPDPAVWPRLLALIHFILEDPEQAL